MPFPLLPKITAVVSFCSNDWRFLKRCIEGISSFSHQILITVCDHFFDGTKENYALLQEAFHAFPNCTFLVFSFHPEKSYRLFSPLSSEHLNWRHEWHNTGRYLSYFYSAKESEFLFFLDTDEIVEKERFEKWLKEEDLSDYTAIRFAGRWHFREACFEALSYDDLSLLVRKKEVDPLFLFDEDERMGLFQKMPEKKKRQVCGQDGIPLIRHYSGVRTEEEFRKKLKCWGHHWERDWEKLLQEEFSRPFNGSDFIRRFTYRSVEPFFDPLKEEVPSLPFLSLEEYVKGLHRFPNVIMVSEKDVLKRQLIHDFIGNHH